MKQPKVTIKIPKQLYDHLAGLIADSGFNSVTEFVVYVLRDIAYEGNAHQAELSPREMSRIKDKLRLLGYL